jgi:GntR family transcriptional regulator / MocR family aminotransferase
MIEDGLYGRHVRRMRRQYVARHELIETILRNEFAPWLEAVRWEGGLHITARLQRKTQLSSALQLLEAETRASR